MVAKLPNISSPLNISGYSINKKTVAFLVDLLMKFTIK